MAGADQQRTEVTVSTEAAPPSQAGVPVEMILISAGVLVFGMAVTLLVAYLLQRWNRFSPIWLRAVCAALVWPLMLLGLLVVVGMAAAERSLVETLSELVHVSDRVYGFFALTLAFDWLAAIALFSLIRWRARRKQRASFGVFE